MRSFHLYFSLIILALLFVASDSSLACNPFFKEYKTPFKIAPFEQIKDNHFRPALKEGIKRQEAEIEKIVNNPEAPTFANTIEVLEYSGAFLVRVESVFWNYTSTKSTETLDKLDEEISPLLTRLVDDIFMNPKLFARVKVVYEQSQKKQSKLAPEQQKLLEETYKSFARRGINLPEAEQAEVRKINERIAALKSKFKTNLQKETKGTTSFRLVLTEKDELVGLPEGIIAAAAALANAAAVDKDDPDPKLKGKYLFTTDRTSMYPFLTYSQRRDLREKLHRAYFMRGDNDNDYDNKAVTAEIINLRIKKAKIMGFEHHAGFVLDENMAKTAENVKGLLDKVWSPALKVAKQEVKDLQAVANEEGTKIKLESWDWRYYAEKLRAAKYDLNESELKPYFELSAVLKGAFEVVNRLYGITFEELTDVPKYDPDVRAFEVKEADGSHIGVLYMDFYTHNQKRGGAWMSGFRQQIRKGGKFVHPIIVNVFNFPKPTEAEPALLSSTNVITLYHELGHGLHGLLSNSTYPSLSGTNVARDFVELPSQILENWAFEPEVLKFYAKHYKTGKVIPDKLVKKMKDAKNFNEGFATVEYMSAVYLDLVWHSITEVDENLDVNAFETQALKDIGLIPEIVVRYRTTYFQHIFSHSYDAGYYAYIWAEVFDADGFEAFKEVGIFNKELATSFRENILARGSTEPEMDLYLKFRGAEPKIEPLLRRKGFIK